MASGQRWQRMFVLDTESGNVQTKALANNINYCPTEQRCWRRADEPPSNSPVVSRATPARVPLDISRPSTSAKAKQGWLAASGTVIQLISDAFAPRTHPARISSLVCSSASRLFLCWIVDGWALLVLGSGLRQSQTRDPPGVDIWKSEAGRRTLGPWGAGPWACIPRCYRPIAATMTEEEELPCNVGRIQHSCVLHQQMRYDVPSIDAIGPLCT
ncbi:hypothetical protein LTR28_004899 [Elasticomyces elasticus]|nr:hypothetical protein LTR28_004899 [Elasticomyces elasticus]